MKHILAIAILGLFQLNAQITPVKISEDSAMKMGPCEPSISINPRDPSKIVAGSILNRIHTSIDSGKTWSSVPLKSEFGVWGDPCVVTDTAGRVFYFHLSDPDGKNWASSNILDRIVCQYSDDNGDTWPGDTYIGLNSPKDQDKEWAVVDQRSNAIYISWTQFDKYGSKDSKDESNILFSSSFDNGQTWSNAIDISTFPGDCIDDDNTVEGAVPAAGDSGHVYVAWAGDQKIWFNHSTDYGKTWLPEEKYIATQKGGWTMEIPGLNRTNGMPVTICDQSQGKYHGRVYVCWADKRNGEDNSDIWIIYSDNHGANWSSPSMIHPDPEKKHQFLPWITVDQVTGHLHAIYYDRTGEEGKGTKAVYSRSIDGGETWTQEILSAASFSPIDLVFFGDYNHIDANNGIVRPIWTEYAKGKLSVWTALLNGK